MNGGRGIRVADSEGFGDLENFVVNGRLLLPVDDETTVSLGAGYIHGTIYDAVTAEHIDPTVTGPRNGAYDLNARVDYRNFAATGEFVSTLERWPAVNHRVSAWKAELAYLFDQTYRPFTVSLGYSEGIQGPAGSQFEFNKQLVIGGRVDFTPNVYGTIEWVRSEGFAPLINIATVSDRNVVQNSAVLGLVVVL